MRFHLFVLIALFPISLFAEVKVEGSHSLYLRSDGSLWGSGINTSGQLLDYPSPLETPVKLVSGNVIDMDAGTNFSLFVKDDGSAWGMGENGSGQLGTGNTFNSSVIVQIFAGNVMAVSAGDSHSAFLMTDGSLWMTGLNNYGQLGTGNLTSVSTPVMIEASGVVEVEAGSNHMVYRKSDNSAWVVGRNFEGQLGDGTSSDLSTPIELFSGNITDIAAGFQHSLFLSGNQLWASGQNSNGQLGDGTISSNPTVFYTGQANISEIYAGQNKSAWKKNSNDFYVVGENTYSELGTATMPVQTPHNLTSEDVVSIALGSSFILFETSDGVIFGGGNNPDGVLGFNETSIPTFTETHFPSSYGSGNVISVKYGNNKFHPYQGIELQFIVTDSNGRRVESDNTTSITITPSSSANVAHVYAGIGDGVYGTDAGAETIQVKQGVGSVLIMNDIVETFTVSVTNDGGFGNPNTFNLETSMSVSEARLESYEYSSLLLESDGTLWGAGQNSSYELADSSASDITDAKVLFSSNILDVATGLSHTLLLTHSGELWGVGDNSYTQFGSTGMSIHSSPVKFVSGNVVKVDAGDNSSYYLTKNGDLYGVGKNNFGQLGDGANIDLGTPFLISGNVMDMSAGSYHMAFLKDDGSLWATGQNTSGELGDGTGSNQNTPVMIVGGNVSRVFCSRVATFYTETNGVLYGTGSNANGELGDGSNSNQLSPIVISERHIVKLSGSDANSFMVDIEGSMYATGYNTNGEFGIGNNNGVSYFIPTHKNIQNVAVGTYYSFFVQEGEVFAMGETGYGRYGNSAIGGISNNTPQVTLFPNIIGRPVHLSVVAVSSSLGLESRGTLTVQVEDEFGNLIESDNSTMVTFNMSGNGQVYGVKTGFGDGSYGVVGGAETVQLLNGQASVSISDDTLETLFITLSNDAGLINSTVNGIDISLTPSVGKVAVGQNFTLFLNAQGDLYGAGRNDYGQLAKTYIGDENLPVWMASSVSEIAANEGSSYFVKSDGSLWAVGEGGYGQLGDGMSVSHNYAVEVESDSVDKVEAGNSYMLYLKNDTSLWGVGRNDFGQLGDGTSVNQSSPVEIYGTGVLGVTTGGSHSLVLKSDGSVWAFGEGAFGQLGDGVASQQTSPVSVTGMSANVVAIAAGGEHSLFLLNDGSLWATGKNTYGQLGDGSNSQANTPIQVVAGNVTDIYAGKETSFYKKNDGSVWAAGQNINGEFGNGTTSDSTVFVEIISSGLDLLDSNYSVTMFLYEDGSLMVSGHEANGEFAIGNSGPQTFSNQVEMGYSENNLGSVDAMSYTAKVLDTVFNPNQSVTVTIEVLDVNGALIGDEDTLEFTLSVNNNASIDSVYSGQGDGSYGVVAGTEVITAKNGIVKFTISDSAVESFDLTMSNNRSVSGPTTLSFTTDANASAPKVEAGRNTSFYLTTVGELYGSGQNDFGQLGDGTSVDQQSFKELFSTNILDVSSGYSHTLFLKTDGSVWATGENNYGQLGDGTNTNQPSPVLVYAANVIAIAAGEYHSLFLLNDGTLEGAGKNDFGELGDGTNLNQSSPVFISSGVVGISAGDHSLFLKNDGSLYGMGQNTYGQLGDGSNSQHSTPYEIESSGVTQIFTGKYTSFYLKEGGSLWGMGKGDWGELGDGMSVSYNTPVEILSDGVSYVTGGFQHTLLIKTDGSLWAFGQGTNGELGDGSSTNQASPVEIESSGVTSVSAGENFSLYLKNGQVYFMGSNGFGALGDSVQGGGPFSSPVLTDYPQLIGTPSDIIVESSPSSLGVDQQGTISVSVIDGFGGVVSTDQTTIITFQLSGNAQVIGIEDGFGDGSYEVLGGSESVQVKDGVASIVISDDTVELLSVTVTNDSSLLNPSQIDIDITAEAPSGRVDQGSHVSVYMTANGALYGAGKNDLGQLGNADYLDKNTPILLKDSGVVDASAGRQTIYYVLEDGSLYGVGRGTEGQLAGGMNTDHYEAQQMESESVIRVDGGGLFVLYLKDDGSIWSVGDGFYGQIGDGSSSARNTPYEVFSSSIVDFSAGGSHSLFVKDDGTAWGVGRNTEGQLGDGSSADKSTAVQITGLSGNVVSVSAGENYSLFLMEDGSVYSAGENTYGQLGDGTNSMQPSPVLIFSGNITEVYAGSYTSFFMKNDGSVLATGRNSNGEFGDGNSTDQSTPVEVSSSGILSIGSWEEMTLFLMSDGRVMGSGYETSGEMALSSAGFNNYYTRVETGFPESSAETVDAVSYSVTVLNTNFNPAQGALVTVKFLDSNGDVVTNENSLEVTLSVNNNAFIESVAKGQGDGSYGVVAGSETITTRDGQVSFRVNDSMIEIFELSFSNNRGVSGLSSLEFTTDANASTPKVEAGRNTSFYLTTVGELYGSGQNDMGQLGDGTSVDQQNFIELFSSNILDVSSGYSHTLFLKTDGSVWATGENSYGQLGDGTNSSQPSPVLVYAANVIAIATGEYHSLFLLNDGTLEGAGKNDFGELGDGTNSNQSTPVFISSDVAAISAGDHSLFLKNDGSLHGMGQNNYGQLGDGASSQHSTPYQIEAAGVSQIFAGRYTSFYLKDDGSLWGMGKGTWGELGDGQSVNHGTPVEILSSDVSYVTGGYEHTLMIKTDGSLWAFGQGSSGQLGDGSNTSQASPVQIESSGVTSVSAGEYYSIYLKNGQVYFMGSNSNGALGDSVQGGGPFNTPVLTDYPQLIGTPADVVVEGSPSSLGVDQQGTVSVSVIDGFGGVVSTDQTTIITFQLSGNGQVLGVEDGFGDGSYEVLGGAESVQVKDGIASIVVSDDTIELLSITVTNDASLLNPAQIDIDITAEPSYGRVDQGSHVSVYMTADGSLYGAGKNNYGQLANVDFLDKNIPILLKDSGVIDASAGRETVYYVLEDGSLHGIGRGTEGQLAGGMNTDHYQSQEMESESVVRVDGGGHFVLYLKDDGSVWSVGDGFYGQIGDGSASARNTPYEVFSSSIVDFSAGGSHSLFVKDDGTAWGVGRNTEGQLGDGTSADKSTAVQITGLSGNVVSVSAGENYSLFLMEDGSVYSAGENTYGQLGDGTNSAQPSPVLVFSDNITEVYAGSYTSFFIKNDGSVWATGRNSNGEFGDGNSTDQSTPIQVSSSGILSIGSWEEMTLFLMSDGRVMGSGYETSGEMALSSSGFNNYYTRVETGFPQSSAEAAVAASYSITVLNTTFNPAQGALVRINVLDSEGDVISNENTLEFTLSVNNSAFIESVTQGQGDGSYGVVAGSETITVRNGQLTFLVNDSVIESFELSISNNRGVSGLASLEFMVDANASSPKVETGRGSSFYLTTVGELYGSGQNDFGQLGDGSAVDQQSFIELFSSNILDVSSGYGHTLFLKTDGSVWATGENSYGQLGDGTNTNQPSPVLIYAANVIAIAAGENHSLFLLNDGTLEATGKNDFGELGDGTSVSKNFPVFISNDVAQISAGAHSLFLKTDGSLHGMGQNFYGELGDGANSQYSVPYEIESSGVSQIFTGRYTSFYLKDDGSLWGMGKGDWGQLGDGTNAHHSTPIEIESSDVSFVASGADHTLFIKSDGSLWAFGQGSNGELGDGTSTNQSTPVEIESSGVTSVSAGENFSIYLKNGQVYFMGSNGYGALGDAAQSAGPFTTPILTNYPQLVGSPSGVIVESAPIDLGVDQQGTVTVAVIDGFGGTALTDQSTMITFQVSGNGKVLGVVDGFGDGSYDVLGGTESVQVKNGVASVVVSDDTVGVLTVTVTNNADLLNPDPVSININATNNLGRVDVGDSYTLYVTADGALYGSGQNDFGQLASSDFSDKTDPVELVSHGVIDASAALDTTYYVTTNGELWAVGQGSYGQLGDGFSVDSSTPVKIESSDVERVEAGGKHALYLKNDGSLWGVGRNTEGQLGDGSAADKSTPIEIFNSSIVDFSAGENFSLFLKDDGTVWSSGENGFGQLGDGTITARYSTVQVIGMSGNIVAVSAGDYHSLFLLDDGSVWACGDNSSGQLGDGTNTPQSTPIQIFTSDIVEIFAGSSVSFFKKSDGSFWATGENGNGELGDGTSVNKNTPIQLFASGIYSAESRANLTLFLKEDGSVYGSGYEANGGLALGNSSPSTFASNILTGYLQSNGVTASANSYVASVSSVIFNPLHGTEVTLDILDTNGDLIVNENSLEFTLSVNSNAYVESVLIGQGDDVYSTVAGTEVITARNGQISFTLNTTVNENFTLTVSNHRSVAGPVSLDFTADSTVTKEIVEAGSHSAFYLTETGTLYGSGRNDFDQLGDGSSTDQHIPIELFTDEILSVSSGMSHSLFLKMDGSVWSVGENSFGQLGDGTLTTQNSPVQVFTGNVVSVWAGFSHSLFLLNNGELWGAGENGSGQLGQGTTTSSESTPVLIDTDVLHAAAGYHTLYVKTDGSLWSVGINSSGQLGDGTINNRSVPYKVEDSGVSKCFAGQYFSFFVKTDSSLWAMGEGASGQLGDGTSTAQYSPVEIMNSGVSEVTGGYDHSLIVMNDGSLWAMGAGSFGQLGDGSTASQPSPIQIETDGVTSVSAGQNFSVYLKDDLVYFMGANDYGAAGNSFITNFNTPVLTSFVSEVSDNLIAQPLMVNSTLFMPPTSIEKGTGSHSIMEWEFLGGANIETIDNLNFGIVGDIYDIETFEVLDVTSGNTLILSGNAISGNMNSGNVEFTNASIVVSGNELRRYQLAVTVSPSTSVDNIQLDLNPDSIVMTGGNIALGNVVSSGLIQFTASAANIVPEPLVLLETGYVAPSLLDEGSGPHVVLEWELVGGANIETFDSLMVNVSGDIYDIEHFEVVDVTSGNFSVYSGNAYTGNVNSGNLEFLNSPQTVLSYETRRYQLEVAIATTTSLDNIQFELTPYDVGLSGGNMASGNLVNSSLIEFNTVPVTPTIDIGTYSVSMGASTSYYVDNGQVWSRGRNGFGQLGHSGNGLVFESTAMTNIVSLAVGELHGISMSDNGSVYTWGANNFEQANGSSTPVEVTAFSGSAVWVGAGAYSSYILNDVGMLYAAGRNHLGQLGLGFDSVSSDWSQLSLPSGNVEKVAAGVEHVMLIIDGALYGFGSDGFGQLAGNASNVITLIDNSQIWTDLGAGSFHSLVLASNGNVHAFGKNNSGQLGLGYNSASESNLTEIPGLDQVESLAAGLNHSVFLRVAGPTKSIFTTGVDTQGQLGLGYDTNIPVEVPAYSNVNEVSAGPFSTIFKDSDFFIYMMGRAFDESNYSTPILIEDLTP